MNYNKLINNIKSTHNVLHASVSKAINTGTTIRNWLFGFYIVEFEQNGEDRAKYGDNLLSNISKSVKIKGLSVTNLSLFRQFYRVYPEIGQALNGLFAKNNIIDLNFEQFLIHQSATDKSSIQIHQSAADELQDTIIKLISESGDKKMGLKPSKLITLLSFTHLVELIKIEDEHKRAFYELECAKGVWSVRELKRQIESLYLERAGLSKDKEKLAEFVNNKAIQLKPKDIINAPFSIEFLGFGNFRIGRNSEKNRDALQNQLIHSRIGSPYFQNINRTSK